jgi:MFS family permease
MTKPEVPTRSLWRVRDYWIYWWARAGSVLGSQVSYIAVPLYAVAVFPNTAQASLVTVCGYGSGLLFALPAGVVGDRYNRRLVLVAADVGRAAGLGVLTWQAAAGSPSLPVTCAVALGVGALNVVFDSAAAAALPDLVGVDLVARAMARNQSRDFALALVGPLLGATLFAAGAQWAFALDLGTYVLSALLLSFLATPLTPPPATRPDGGGSLAAIRGGLARVRADRPLRQTMLYLSVLNLVLTAGVFAVVAHFQTIGQTAAVGIVLAAQSVGGLVGSVAADRLCARFSPTTLLYVHGATWFAGLVVTAAFPTAPVAAVTLALVWLVAPAVRVAFGAHLVAVVAPELRARVNSASALSASTLSPVGPLLAGLLLTVVGFGAVLTTLAGIALLAVVGLIVVPDRIRRLDWTPAHADGGPGRPRVWPARCVSR